MKHLTNKPPTSDSKGLRFGNFVQGREVIEEELDAVFAEGRTPRPRPFVSMLYERKTQASEVE